MSDKRKKVKATSPKGQIRWFKFVKPDQKFKKYTADLVVDDTPELRKIMEKMESEIEAALVEAREKQEDPAKRKKIKKADDRPIEEQLDAQGNPTGKYVMKFRMKSEGVNKEKQVYQINPPALFHGNLKPYTAEEKAKLQVFNGSTCQVAFELSTYALATGAVGATLRPTACQIIKIEQLDADASQFGFGATELEQGNDESEFEQEAQAEAKADTNEDF